MKLTHGDVDRSPLQYTHGDVDRSPLQYKVEGSRKLNWKCEFNILKSLWTFPKTASEEVYNLISFQELAR